jgi:hypothetical protein
MNAIKKLRDMGFKKTQFHKVGYDSVTYESIMVPDIEETKSEYKEKEGRNPFIKVEKKHPKSDSFWTLKYSENYILWCLVKNHQIDKIWLENKLIKPPKNNIDNISILTYKAVRNRSKDEERVQLIFDLSNRESFPLHGKNQIMNLFPKEVRRDFLLEQLFGF